MSRIVAASKRPTWIALTIALVIQTGLISIQARRRIDTSFVRVWIMDSLAPMEKLVDRSSHGFLCVWDGYIALIGVHNQNQQLKHQVDELQMKLQQNREDLAELKVSDVGVRVYGNGLLVSSRLIAENPKVVQGFVRAMNRSFREMLANPDAAVKALNARDPLTEYKPEMERITLLRPAIETSRTRTTGFGHVDMATLANQVEYVASSVQLKAKPKAEELFNASFLPPLAERLPLR